MRRWSFPGRAEIAAGIRGHDVRAAALLWCRRLPVRFRALARGTLLISGIAACSVYDATDDQTITPPDASSQRDGEDDGSSPDGFVSSDAAAGGSGGTGGADVRQTDNGGADGRDVGSGGASGRDAPSDGVAGQGPGPLDGQNDSALEGGEPGDGANDGSSDSIGDAAQDCFDDACSDGAGTDADGGPDQCPTDPGKTEPGICGCGTPDTDSDTDGAPDCVDACPSDVRKTQPGVCGCQAEDPPDLDAGQAFCLKALLAHRYSFNGTGTTATDSIAMANGAIMGGSNANLSGGSLDLSGDLGSRYTSEGYVNLPSHILNPFTNATFEVWLTWRGTGSSGGRNWQRIFDFGDQVTSGSELVGKTYFFLTAQASGATFPRAAVSSNGTANETFVTATQAIALNVQTHLAVVVDDANNTIALYLNGNPDGTVAWTGALSSVNEVNAWLGRSNFGVDPELNGILHEFRIYRVALTAAQVRTSFTAGPDPSFF